MGNLQFVFVSNYINHHQIPFCNAMYRELDGSFIFIQTEPMEEERVKMGWQDETSLPYVKYFYEEPEECGRLILDARVALFGGTDEESYIAPRLAAGRPVLRYSERLYKTGQWKAVTPRGLLKKYKDHTKYRNAPVYLLCSGAYVPSDFHIVRAYPGKMFCWGYFPETKHYDVDRLMAGKGYRAEEEAHGQEPFKSSAEPSVKPYLLWAARFIDWKHPFLPVKAAAWLKEHGCSFHMDIIGGGGLESEVRKLVAELKVEDCVTLTGFCSPREVRSFMEKADIYMVTSDRQEGWGAVVNEAMNSGCAVVADHMVGAVPYLIKPEQNGRIYRDGDEEMFFRMLEELCRDRERCALLGRAAYETITQVWNPENAAKCLLELCDELGMMGTMGRTKKAPHSIQTTIQPGGPCSPAPVISERTMYKWLNSAGKEQGKK